MNQSHYYLGQSREGDGSNILNIFNTHTVTILIISTKELYNCCGKMCFIV